MKFRWFLCLLISLGLHVFCLYGMQQYQQAKQPQLPMQIALAAPESAQDNLDLQASKEIAARPIEPKEPSAAEPEAQKFQPNLELEKEELAAVTPDMTPLDIQETTETEQEKIEPEDPHSPVAQLLEPKETPQEQMDTEWQKEPALTPADYQREINQYRKELLGQFDDQWQKVPELNTLVRDSAMLSAIDDHFGITVIAYGFVEHKPAAPFIVFSGKGTAYSKADSIDFSSYSNRFKDRSLSNIYQQTLSKAQQEYKIDSFMKIIGLIPIETDRYFASKQLQSVQLAGLSLENVKTTTGHYEPDYANGFVLIIDSVVTTEGKTISVKDEELKYSMLSKNN